MQNAHSDAWLPHRMGLETLWGYLKGEFRKTLLIHKIKKLEKFALVSTPDGGITLIMVFPSTPSGMVEREEWMDRWCCGP